MGFRTQPLEELSSTARVSSCPHLLIELTRVIIKPRAAKYVGQVALCYAKVPLRRIWGNEIRAEQRHTVVSPPSVGVRSTGTSVASRLQLFLPPAGCELQQSTVATVQKFLEFRGGRSAHFSLAAARALGPPFNKQRRPTSYQADSCIGFLTGPEAGPGSPGSVIFFTTCPQLNRLQQPPGCLPTKPIRTAAIPTLLAACPLPSQCRSNPLARGIRPYCRRLHFSPTTRGLVAGSTLHHFPDLQSASSQVALPSSLSHPILPSYQLQALDQHSSFT
jgi:hypothetical protein